MAQSNAGKLNRKINKTIIELSLCLSVIYNILRWKQTQKRFTSMLNENKGYNRMYNKLILQCAANINSNVESECILFSVDIDFFFFCSSVCQVYVSLERI